MSNKNHEFKWESPEFKSQCKNSLLSFLSIQVNAKSKLYTQIGLQIKSARQIRLLPLIIPTTSRENHTPIFNIQNIQRHKQEIRITRKNQNSHQIVKPKQFNFTKIIPLRNQSTNNINRHLNRTVYNQDNVAFSIFKHKSHIKYNYPQKKEPLNISKTTFYNEEDSDNDLQQSQILNEWKKRLYGHQL